MKHNNENLSARSDDYISKLVSIIELNKAGHKAEMWQMQTFKDYCNEPALIMPIAFDNLLTVTPGQIVNGKAEYWDSSAEGGYYPSCHENPLRALAQTIILMNQVNA